MQNENRMASPSMKEISLDSNVACHSKQMEKGLNDTVSGTLPFESNVSKITISLLETINYIQSSVKFLGTIPNICWRTTHQNLNN